MDKVGVGGQSDGRRAWWSPHRISASTARPQRKTAGGTPTRASPTQPAARHGGLLLLTQATPQHGREDAGPAEARARMTTEEMHAAGPNQTSGRREHHRSSSRTRPTGLAPCAHPDWHDASGTGSRPRPFRRRSAPASRFPHSDPPPLTRQTDTRLGPRVRPSPAQTAGPRGPC